MADDSELNLSGLIPSRYKTYVTAVSGLLGLIAPAILTATTSLPQPWPIVVGAIFWILGIFGVYKGKYIPDGAVLAPATTEVINAAAKAANPAAPRENLYPE